MMQLIYGVLEELSNIHLNLGEWPLKPPFTMYDGLDI